MAVIFTSFLLLNLWLICGCGAKPLQGSQSKTLSLEKAKKENNVVPQIFGLKESSRRLSKMSKMALPFSGPRHYDPWGGKRSTLPLTLPPDPEKDTKSICLHIGSLVMYNYA